MISVHSWIEIGIDCVFQKQVIDLSFFFFVLIIIFVGTKTWENTVGSSLSTKSDIFQPGETIGLGFWSLIDFTDPSLLFGIKPPSTSTKRSSHSSSNSTSTTPTSAPTVPKKRKALEEKKEVHNNSFSF